MPLRWSPQSQEVVTSNGSRAWGAGQWLTLRSHPRAWSACSPHHQECTRAGLTLSVTALSLQMSCALTTPTACCTPRKSATLQRCCFRTRPVRRSCRASGQGALLRTVKTLAASDPAPSNSFIHPCPWPPRQGGAEGGFRDLQPPSPSEPPLGPLRHRPALSFLYLENGAEGGDTTHPLGKDPALVLVLLKTHTHPGLSQASYPSWGPVHESCPSHGAQLHGFYPTGGQQGWKGQLEAAGQPVKEG